MADRNVTPSQDVALADPVFSIADVASLTGLSEHGVRYAHRTRRLRGFVLSGKMRFRLSAVEEFLRRAENGDQ